MNAPRAIRFAQLIRWNDVVYVSAAAETTTGVLVDREPVIAVSEPSEPHVLGRAIVESIARFTKGVIHPLGRGAEALPDPILKATKARSRTQLWREGQDCGIEQEHGLIRFLPTRRGKSRGTFFYKPEIAVEVQSETSDLEIGRAALEALSRCS